jgi:putative ABC transport system permease protein
MSSAQAQITALLRQRHGLAIDQDNDFDIFNQKDVADTVSTVTGIVKLLLGAISSLSLIVGGIGIMNIMLVSVTERTREIGIRLAIGAHDSDIRLQFLIEAIALSLIGGALGIAGGLGLSELVASKYSIPAEVSITSIILAFGFSALVGILFGFYPAYKASKLDPIDALRFE